MKLTGVAQWLRYRRFMLPLPAVLGVIAAIVVLAFPALDRPFGSGQTWVLSATTHGARLQFSGNGNAWPLHDVTICEARPVPLRRAPDGIDQDICNAKRFVQRAEDHFFLTWPDKSEIELRFVDDRFEILLPEGGVGLRPGSLISVSGATFAKLGALSFAGAAELGSAMSTGARGFLIQGTYSVREIGVISRLTRRRTDVVKEGELIQGDTVAIVKRSASDQLVTGFGHLTISANSGQKAMDMVFHSSTGASMLRVLSFGQEDPTLIEPDWLERVIANPFQIVIAFFVSLTAGFIQLFDSLRKRAPRSEG
jgi:hypothetical protein